MVDLLISFGFFRFFWSVSPFMISWVLLQVLLNLCFVIFDNKIVCYFNQRVFRWLSSTIFSTWELSFSLEPFNSLSTLSIQWYMMYRGFPPNFFFFFEFHFGLSYIALMHIDTRTETFSIFLFKSSKIWMKKELH